MITILLMLCHLPAVVELMNISREDLFSATPDIITDSLENQSVFIGGAGGLGSNVAVMLCRAGIGNITIADFDIVEPSNINRQYYFCDQIGELKVEAIRSNLLRINPAVSIDIVTEKLTTGNFYKHIRSDFDIVFECFDAPDAKAQLVSFMLTERPDIPVIAVSGLAGYGPVEDISTSRGPQKLFLIGDMESEACDEGTLSTRVNYAASMQAHLGVRILIGEEPFN
jgi:sulfur carrier protein ThiS adenylyltransferase